MVASCIPRQTSPLPPKPSLTPTFTSTATATTVWFPPTSTPTPFPTALPSPDVEISLNLGKMLLEDDFSTGEDWLLGQFSGGSIAIGKNELTIHVAQPMTYLYSIRKQPELTDFYLEITASPMLCKNGDEYGVLFRVSSMADYYRFVISCDGNVKMERVLKDKPSVLQPWIPSGVVLPGAPNTVHISIWVSGKEMRFFIDDYPLFVVSDSTLQSGNLGVFVRSSDQAAVTVNFSSLTVWEIE